MKRKSLWQSADCADWDAALQTYADVIAAQNVNGLAEVDAWYRTELPQRIASRTPAHITREELERVAVWKMKRGVWRERNRLLVIGNDPKLVEQTSAEALAAAPDPRKPIALLSELAGVGPATASAVLAAYAPEVYPFFDELVAAQIPRLGAVSFTLPYYLRYAAQLRERADELKAGCEHHTWTVQDVSQALWAASGGKAGGSGHR